MNHRNVVGNDTVLRQTAKPTTKSLCLGLLALLKVFFSFVWLVSSWLLPPPLQSPPLCLRGLLLRGGYWEWPGQKLCPSLSLAPERHFRLSRWSLVFDLKTLDQGPTLAKMSSSSASSFASEASTCFCSFHRVQFQAPRGLNIGEGVRLSGLQSSLIVDRPAEPAPQILGSILRYRQQWLCCLFSPLAQAHQWCGVVL